MDGTKKEVLRYLGRRGQEVPGDLDGLVDECIALMRATVSPRHVRLSFSVFADGSGLFITEAGITLRGNHIARHLSGCKTVILLAATLGAEADTLILRWKRADITRSLVFDACATQLIEEYCDEIQRKVNTEAAASALDATNRFSPGYGDFSLDIQPDIIRALNAERKIGLTCTEHFILLPRKSVTAIIGLREPDETRKKSPTSSGCNVCDMRDTCNFFK